jgi:hypothetical protein
MMKGIIFFNTEFQQNPIPELYSVDVWDLLMNNTDYIYIDSYESLVQFNGLYSRFEETKSTPFIKPGAYMWDPVYEEWVCVINRIKELVSLSDKMYNLFVSAEK